MTIKKLLFIRQCDIKGCRRIANYSIYYDENDPRTQMSICAQCLEDIAKAHKSTKNKGKVKDE